MTDADAALRRELTRVAPDEFVETRSALVKRLRAEGRRDEAAAMAKLRRPPPALWAVNALAGAAPDRLTELVGAAEAMRDGTQAALQGRRTDLARLSATHGRLVDELASRAMEALASAGRAASGDTRARIWMILRAASTDPAIAPDLARGTLLTEPAASGFEGMDAFALAPAAALPEVAEAPDEDIEAGTGIAAPDDRALRERAAREDAVRAAAREVETRAGAARELREQLAAARERAERARADLARAEREERRLDTAAEEAERAARRARRELDRLQAGAEDEA